MALARLLAVVGLLGLSGGAVAAAPGVDPLLASTPEFDLEDPVLVAKADELGRDPARIFAFVRDEIEYQVYRGSLRGARGALWSQGGNSLDKSNLLVALLRISGVAAGYARGTLSDDDAKTLIASMFDPTLMAQATCMIPEDQPRADPVNDPELIAEARDHWWVQLDDGTSLDPSFKNNSVGRSRATATATADAVPADEQHKVTYRLVVHKQSPFGFDETSTPLEVTFIAAFLQGKHVYLSHFTDTQEVTGLIGISNITFTYTPYFKIDDLAQPAVDAKVVTGTPYQEFASSLFPLANSIVSHLDLELDNAKPGGPAKTERRTVLERLSNRPGEPAAFLDQTFRVGISADASAPSLPVLSALLNFAKEIANEYSTDPHLDDLLGKNIDSFTSDDFIKINELLSRGILMDDVFASIISSYMTYGLFSLQADIAKRNIVKAYNDGVRFTLITRDLEGEMAAKIDLRTADLRVIAPPGQSDAAAAILRTARGFYESAAETIAAGSFTAGVSSGIYSAFTVFSQAISEDIEIRFLTNVVDAEKALDEASASVEARERVLTSIHSGNRIWLPTRPVAINGEDVTAWYQLEPNGHVVGVTEDGGHQALYEDTENRLNSYLNNPYATAERQQKAREALDIIKELRTLQNNVKIEIVDGQQYIRYITQSPEVQAEIVKLLAKKLSILNFIWPFGVGGLDPSFGRVFFREKNIELVSCFAPLDELQQDGQTFAVVPDPSFEVWRPWGRLPSALTVTYRDAPKDGEYRFEFQSGDPAWEILEGRNTAVLKKGGTARLSIFPRPKDENFIPPVGTAVPLTVTVRGPDGAVVGTPLQYTYTVPALTAANVSSSGAPIVLTPGHSATVPVTLTNSGNTAQTYTLTLDLPPGVTASGLTSPVTLDPGKSVTLQLVLTGDGLALNSTVSGKVVATFGPNNEKTQEFRFDVRVLDANSAQALVASDAATEVGRPQLAGSLDSVATTVGLLAAAPADQNQRSRLVGLLNTLIDQLNAAGVRGSLSALTTARSALQTATSPADTAQALANLGASLHGLGQDLAALPDLRTLFTASLSPNTREAQPNQPAVFDLIITNSGTQANTYVVDLGPLPAGVTGSLSRNRVTLQPGQSTNLGGLAEVSLTLTAGGQSVRDVSFALDVAVEGSPQSKRTVTGALIARQEFVRIVSVDLSPGAAEPGGKVKVAAKVLNAVNRTRQASASYQVKDAGGRAVFTSTPVDVTLSVLAALNTIDLGELDTARLAKGSYTLIVTLTDGGVPLPGGSNEAPLMIGLPVSASLTATPATLTPGNGVITASLKIESLIDLPDPKITLLSQTDTDANATSLAVKDGLAYVCGTENVSIINVSNPAAPELVATFADDLIVNAGISKCKIVDDQLIVFWQVGTNADELAVLVYSLQDPLAPQLIGQTNTGLFFLTSIFFKDNIGFATAHGLRFFFASVVDQFGDLVSIDFTDPTNPQVLDALFDTDGSPYSGPYGIHHGTEVDNQTIYAASTTSQGALTQSGAGRVLVVDTSDPGDLKISAEVQVPGTIHVTGIALEGDRALIVGNTGGYLNFDFNRQFPYTGNVVLAVLDISDRRDPKLIGHQVVTSATSRRSNVTNPLRNGFFAVSGTAVDGKPVLMIVDANDPNNLSYSTIEVPAVIDESQVIGNLLYAPSAVGLGIFDIGDLVGSRYAARVEVPKNGGVSVVPGSFSIAPTEIVSSEQSDTLVWDRSLTLARNPETVSWQLRVDNLQPGEVRPIVLGGRVGFTTPDGSTGEIPLAPLSVGGERLLTLTPDARTVQAGSLASYALQLSNPTPAPQTFALNQLGLPAGWVSMPRQVTVPAGASASVPIVITTPAGSPPATMGMVVTASSPSFGDSVQGALIVQAGVPVPGTGPDASGNVRAVELADATGTPAVAGQGTTASFNLRVTNTGTVDDIYALSAAVPAGFIATFSEPEVTVSPGLSGWREVLMTVRAPIGGSLGSHMVTVTAQSKTTPSVSDQVTVTVGLVSQGATAELRPTQGQAGETFTLTVTNNGGDRETFSLLLSGPGALYAKLAATSVTLDPAASQTISIITDPARSSIPGSLLLQATATAQSAQAVHASATASMLIPTRAAVAARFDPAERILSAPGASTFLLLVENRGNSEDAYKAEITGVSGGITAQLEGLDGQLANAVPLFRLPGLMTAALPMTAGLDHTGVGTITVRVTSLTDPGLSVSATASLRFDDQQSQDRGPVCRASVSDPVPVGAVASLDGTRSYDPDGQPSALTYQWTLSRVPPQSNLSSADITGSNAPSATFRPDAAGVYSARLSCSDGEKSSTAVTCVTVGGVRLEQAGTYKTMQFDKSAALRLAYAPSKKRLFVTNLANDSIDVLDISNPASPTQVTDLPSIDVSAYGHPRSLAIRKGILAATVRAIPATSPGKVMFFDTAGRFLNMVTVGSQPRDVVFTTDGTKLLVSNVGSEQGDTDPEGTISIIDLSNGVAGATAKSLDFAAFDRASLVAKGVRFQKSTDTVSQDLEPNSIALARDQKTAWVTLRENNAVAIIDIEAEQIRDVVGLGAKDFNKSGLDASDRDESINIRKWPIFGLYQPDGVSSIGIDDRQAFLTANTGGRLTEAMRVRDLLLNPISFPHASAFQLKRNLGQLLVSPLEGDVDLDGAFEQLYAYGGRSFALWDENARLIWDSGDQFERIVAKKLPQNFNVNDIDNNSLDIRSPYTGPQPQRIATGRVDTRLYAFITLTQVGGVMVYDIASQRSPCFAGYVNNRDFAAKKLREEVENGGGGDLSPSDVLFIPAINAPNHIPLLIVANKVSGTTTIYAVNTLH